MLVACALEPLLGDDRTQSTAGENQWRQHGRPTELQAQQEAEQDAVVAEESGLAISLGVAATLRSEQAGHATQEGAAEQRRSAKQDGQQAQQAAQRMALEENLTETVEQGSGPVGAVGVEVVGRHVGV